MLIFGSLFYTKYTNKTNLGNLVKNPRIFFFFFFRSFGWAPTTVVWVLWFSHYGAFRVKCCHF
jgi:hypothetical protein